MTAAPSRRAVLGALALAALAPAALAAPAAHPWPRWQASDESSGRTIDHGAWDRFLARYLRRGGDGINRVAYRRVLPADREALSLYVATLAGLPITSYRRAEQQVYWINLYNALTLRTVLEHYPVASVLDIRLQGAAFHGPWSGKLLHIEGEQVSLDDIEHRILRPFWHDPRLHYALCTATLGSPNLAPHAYTLDARDAMLDAGAHTYVNQPRGAEIVAGRLDVSSLYVWYKSDFGGSDRGVIEHLRRYAAAPLAAALAEQSRIAGDAYDWSLNDAKGI